MRELLVSRRTRLICILIFFAAITALIGIEIPRQRQLLTEAREKAKHERAQKHFQELKELRSADKSYPFIDSPELMSMIATDPECARRLTYAHFDMTDLNAPEFQQISKLINVKVISFYDCEGVETLLRQAANMPSINKIYFYYAKPSDALLKNLASIQNLKTVKFNDISEGDLDIFKRTLPHIHFEVGDD
jgi:hypothetical protein